MQFISMRVSLELVSIVAALLATATTGFSQSSPVNIMPLGDSITQGGTMYDGVTYAGYRYPLYFKLQDAGHPVDMVGSMSSVFGSNTPSPQNYPSYATTFDRDHEGHWGWTANGIAPNVAYWAASARPDVVLLHIGTNDIRMSSDSTGTIVDEIGQIINNLRSTQPTVAILLAQIIPFTDGKYASQTYQDRIAALNAALPSLVAAQGTDASPIYLIDQYTGFDTATMTADGCHPNLLGEEYMAQVWFDGLVQNGLVPEPTSVTLFGVGAVALVRRRGRHAIWRSIR